MELELDVFCKEVHPRLVRSLAVFVGDPAVGEELAQDALVRLVVAWERVRLLDAPRMWLYRTAMNLSRSWVRRRAAERRALHRALQRPVTRWSDPDTADVVAVRAAVLALPVRQRAAIVLRYFGDLDVAETAEVLGCAPGTVKALSHQARQRLSAALGSREGDEDV